MPSLFGWTLVRKSKLIGLEQENAMLTHQRARLEEALFMVAIEPPLVETKRRRRRTTILPVGDNGVH